ncbi:MAG TPA: peptidoglycan DD-metalloendopeptidase family protein [Polyangiaceae bacterium]|jgi:septal ring factor EnvC (AmiA/AmiB activator)|nr:peptidoglycan DD-metalloendopeptidase family protein [Polyangiaceae bacterium]
MGHLFHKVALIAPLFGLALSAPASGSSVGRALARPATVADIDNTMAGIDAKEKDLQDQLDHAKQLSDQLAARCVARGRAYVRIARSGLLPVSGGFEALVDHATRLERLRRALMRDLQLQVDNSRLRQTLAQQLGSVKDTSAALEQERGSLARSHAAIAAAEERDDAFRRAFLGESWNPGPHTAVYGADLDGTGGPLPQGGIAALKGRLSFPIAGRAEVHKVARSARRGPGLEMMTHLGAPVRAVYPGRVAFADSYGDYGKTVIIDHGSRYYSVSSNLADVAVSVGDEVAFGQRIGSAAGAPTSAKVDPSNAPGQLYFELRVDGEVRDPSDWFGI